MDKDRKDKKLDAGLKSLDHCMQPISKTTQYLVYFLSTDLLCSRAYQTNRNSHHGGTGRGRNHSLWSDGRLPISPGYRRRCALLPSTPGSPSPLTWEHTHSSWSSCRFSFGAATQAWVEGQSQKNHSRCLPFRSLSLSFQGTRGVKKKQL